jgi:hypothetical protein
MVMHIRESLSYWATVGSGTYWYVHFGVIPVPALRQNTVERGGARISGLFKYDHSWPVEVATQA